MNYQVEISDLAIEQAFEIETYYHRYGPSLGNEFLDALFDCYVSLEANPNRWQCIRNDIRRALVNKFPYSVFYRVQETAQKVEILTVLHQKADPGKWP
jgi:plasmid stabilization system protein ParE